MSGVYVFSALYLPMKASLLLHFESHSRLVGDKQPYNLLKCLLTHRRDGELFQIRTSELPLLYRKLYMRHVKCKETIRSYTHFIL